MPQQTFLLLLAVVILGAGATVALIALLGASFTLASVTALAMSLVLRRVLR